MSIYTSNGSPPFNTTRASHIVLTSKDLDKTRYFYETAIGLEVTHQDNDSLYLRALEETSHHSLVFHRSDEPAVCKRMGYRVYTDDDLNLAYDHFNSNGINAIFVENPFQGRTLHVNDPLGVPLEFCATMEQSASLMQTFHKHHGACPASLDHVQIATHDVETALRWYSDLGFRLTEYTADDVTDEVWGVWLKRKNNTQDVVFSAGLGPRLHHFAYNVPEVANIIHVCDVMSSLGLAHTMDRGPGRHGIANAMFVYFRDPDGHRIELFTSHYQFIDSDLTPKRWSLTDTSRSQLWGLPATERWFYEATNFDQVELKKPLLNAKPVTLESFLEKT
jgi:catechol 2,3-dioxygenase